MKHARRTAGLIMGAAALMGAAGCTSTEWEAVAAGLTMAADEMAVTLTQTPAYGCDYNAQGYAVCDDTGDGWADRYADVTWDYVPGYYTAPATRINDYGEAYQYDGGCDCWHREPSLDTYPK